MDDKEKKYILLKWGLALKTIIDRNKTLSSAGKKHADSGGKNIVNSFGKLEAASGIPKATLVNMVAGRKNAATTTWVAVWEALEIALPDFGRILESIQDADIQQYKTELEKARKKRDRAKIHTKK